MIHSTWESEWPLEVTEFVVVVVVVVVVCCAPWHVGSLFPNQWSNQGPLHWKHGVLTTGLPVKSFFVCFCFFEVTVDEACAYLSVLRDMAGFKNLAWILPECSTWFFWMWTEQYAGFISKNCLTQHKGKAHLLNADSGRSVWRSRRGGEKSS